MEENIYLYQGNSFVFDLEIEGLKQELDSCYLSCKKHKKDDTYIFKKRIGDGINKIEQTENSFVYSLRIAPEDTENLIATAYYYDLQVEIEKDIFTVLSGKLIIKEKITRGN